MQWKTIPAETEADAELGCTSHSDAWVSSLSFAFKPLAYLDSKDRKITVYFLGQVSLVANMVPTYNLHVAPKCVFLCVNYMCCSSDLGDAKMDEYRLNHTLSNCPYYCFPWRLKYGLSLLSSRGCASPLCKIASLYIKYIHLKCSRKGEKKEEGRKGRKWV